MERIFQTIINKSRLVLFLLAVILLLGISSYINIPKEDDPDVKIPIASISINYEGISPEDGVRLLIKPIENELKDMDGIDSISSYARQGGASIIVKFKAGYDIDESITKVRNKVDDAKSNLPADMRNEPIVNEINLSKFPVLNILLTGEIESRELITIARRLQDKIEEIPNVIQVNIIGDREDIVEIEIDPTVIENYGLSLSEIYTLISSNNKLIAAGSIETMTGRYTIKVPGLVENIQEIMNLPIKTDGHSIVKISDIAKIKKTYKDRTNYARINGKPGIALEVVKRTGANVIDTIKEVRTLVKDSSKQLPESINISYSNDNSEDIKNFINSLQNNLLFSISLVLIVVIAFIGISSGILIAVSIPVTFLTGILALYLMGFTLNIVMLFSLILSIGLLVDNSIVIVEYAELKMQEGFSCTKSFFLAVKNMYGALLSSTATTLNVFAPLLFWPGVIGKFMIFLPITLICVLLSSLVTALIFMPTVGIVFSKWLFKAHRKEKEVLEIEKLSEDEYMKKLTGFPKWFAKRLNLILNYPKKVVLIIISGLILVYSCYIFFGTGITFFPSREPSNAKINIRARGNLSLEEKDNIVKEVESRILDMKDDIKIFYAKSGLVGSTRDSEDLIGVINLEYHDWKYRRKSREILKEIKSRTDDLYGIIIEAEERRGGPSSDKPIQIEIKSDSSILINGVVEKFLDYMRKDGEFIDYVDDRSVPAIEWKLEIDREEAVKQNVSIAQIGSMINMITNGIVITTYRPEELDDEVDIIIRFPEERRNLDELNRLKVNGIPVSNFVKRVPQPSVSKIKRINGMRTITIESDVKRGVLADDKIQQITNWIKTEAQIDPRVNIKFSGEEKDKKETGTFLIKAFLYALLGMITILLIQFNSFYNVGIIISAILLSTVGVLLGLLITGRPFSIVMSGIGIIALAGVVVNNNIILIDTYKKFKELGMETKEAILKATTQRLWPIILTSLTTILGLFPMIIGADISFLTRTINFGSPSSQMWTQLSTTIAGGIAFTTVLTLVFTPTLILLGEGRKKDKK